MDDPTLKLQRVADIISDASMASEPDPAAPGEIHRLLDTTRQSTAKMLDWHPLFGRRFMKIALERIEAAAARMSARASRAGSFAPGPVRARLSHARRWHEASRNAEVHAMMIRARLRQLSAADEEE